jgi:hypothetical protein
MWTFDEDAQKRIADFLQDDNTLSEEDLEQAIESDEEIGVDEMRPDGKHFSVPLSKILATRQDPAATTADVIRSRLLPGGPHLYSAPEEEF